MLAVLTRSLIENFLRAVFLVCVLVALPACATRSMRVLRHDLSSRSATCDSFSAMQFAELGVEEKDLSLGSGAPIFNFNEGRSYFAAYRLSTEGSHIAFRSYLTSEFLPDTSVFMPSFAFLDKDKKLVMTDRDVPMQYSGTNFWLGPYYSGTVRVPASASYVVVYTIDAQHPELTATSENGRIWSVPASLSGKLKLAVSH